MLERSHLSRKRVTIFAVGTAAAAALFVAFFAMRPRAEIRVAEHSLESFLRGDLWAVYQSTSEVERQTLNLSKDQVDEIARRYVLPRLKRFKPVGAVERDYQVATGIGTATVKIQAENGATYDLSFDAMRVGDGSAVSFNSVMITAWHLEHLAQSPQAQTSRDGLRALMAGLDKDQAGLEALGYRGNAGRYKQGFASWDQQRQYWAGLLLWLDGKGPKPTMNP